MRLSLPLDSKFDLAKAIELANLIERSYQDYKNFKDPRNPNGRLTPNGTTTGSEKIIDLCVNPDDATVIPKKGNIDYSIVNIINQTIDKNNPIPMGFIAQRKNNQDPSSNDYYVIFRGTMESNEWQKDFRINQAPFTLDNNPKSLGKVAKGFAEIYTQNSNIKTQIQNTFSKLPNSIRIFVSGHSLGGALASLVTRHLVSMGFKPILYTYASPRVGNEDFTIPLAAANCYRVVNSEDAVPYLPLATLNAFGDEIHPNKFVKDRINGIINLAGFLDLPGTNEQYIHLGEPIYFTDNRKSISLNHNMYRTYREALRS